MKFAARVLAFGVFISTAALAQTTGASSFDELSSRATAAREANNIPQAVELYKKAVALKPEWQEGWWSLGLLEYQSDQYADGSDAFRHLVALNAQAAPAWALLGLCEFETGDYARSLADMERGTALGAVKNAHMGEVILYHEALALTLTGQFDKALQKYGIYVRSAPVSDAVLLGIGVAALHARLLPNHIPADQQDLYRAAGQTASLVLAAKYQEADQSFTSLLARYPNASHVHYLYGVYMLERDTGRAIDQFQRELQIEPGNIDALAMLAVALETRGDSNQALSYARKAAQQASKSAMAQYVYGRALVETGDWRRGVTRLLAAEVIDPSNVDVHITLASAYALLGQPVEARREREISLQMTKEAAQLAQR
jgi:predicted Zn-dependent protease